MAIVNLAESTCGVSADIGLDRRQKAWFLPAAACRV
jgi:hypothetical protein